MQLPAHSTYRMKTGRWLETFCSVRAWPKPSVNRQAQFSSSALCALCLSLCISVLPRHLSSFCICISISPGHRRPMALWNNVWKNIGMYVGCGKQVFRPTVRGEHTTPCWKRKRVATKTDWKNVLALNQIGKLNFVYPISNGVPRQTSESSSNLAKSQAWRKGFTATTESRILY